MSDKLLLNFSSKNKNNSVETDSDFTVSFTSSVELNNVVSVKLLNCVFTNTIYNINGKNSTFYYYDGVTDTFITLDQGQYNVNEIINALESKLALAGVVADFNFNNSTYKLELVSSVPAIELYDKKGSIYNKLGAQLGLSGSSGLVGAYSFPNIIDISGLDTLKICSRALTKHGSIDNYVSSSTGQTIRTRTNVIKSLPVSSAFGFKVNYENPNDFPDCVFDKPISLQSLDIQLRDIGGDLIELNGSEVYFSFEVEYLP